MDFTVDFVPSIRNVCTFLLKHLNSYLINMKTFFLYSLYPSTMIYDILSSKEWIKLFLKATFYFANVRQDDFTRHCVIVHYETNLKTSFFMPLRRRKPPLSAEKRILLRSPLFTFVTWPEVSSFLFYAPYQRQRVVKN